jgi:putative transposase
MPSATWPIHVNPNHLYFITTSAVQHAHIFRRDVIKRILVDALNTGRILEQYALFAFVIMPNHVHFIIRCLNDHTPMAVTREFKKATAGLIVRHYEVEINTKALNFLASVAPQDQQYAVWEHEYEAKNIYTPDFLRQKLEYIHSNPLQSQWRLTRQPEDYIWSSARYYLSGGKALIPLSDARELL